MQNLLEKFDQHLLIERNVSEHTRNAYRRDLQEFRSFLESLFKRFDLDRLKQIDRID